MFTAGKQTLAIGRRGAAPPRDSSRVSLVVLEEDPKSLLDTCPIRVPLTATNIYATQRILFSSLTQRAARGSVSMSRQGCHVILAEQKPRTIS